MGTEPASVTQPPAGLKLMQPFICAGSDIGQQMNPSTLVIAEASQHFLGWQHFAEEFSARGYRKARDIPILQTRFDVKFVKRMDLGKEYGAIANAIAYYMAHQQFSGRKRVLRVDITGVGRPVYEMIADAIKHGPEAKLIECQPITFSHGNSYKKQTGVLGKAYGVSRLQALMQTEGIKVAAKWGNSAEARKLHEEVLAMLAELKTYDINIDDEGLDTYGAFKVGTYDDLATGLMLCCLEDAPGNPITYGPKVR